MIVFEEKLGDILDLLPVVKDANDNEFKPFYNWGTQDVLNKYLTIEKNQLNYPLIWLVNGKDEYDEFRQKAKRNNARLVIAMHSDKVDEFNPFIYQTDYKMILNPLLDNIIKALERSNISNIYEGSYSIERLPNYSVTSRGDKNKTVDIWNAIVFDCSIEINSKCLKQIKF